MTIKLADLPQQNHAIRNLLDAAWDELVESGTFVGGESVQNFENEFAAYVGSPVCIGVGNGTDALELALETLNIGPGSKIVLPAMSFAASLEPVLRCGATPIFVDVSDDTFCMDVAQTLDAIAGGADALIAVHLYGRVAEIATSELIDVPIVEDAAQAHGAELGGRRVGSLGQMAAFSFYPGKNLGAFGDAGALTVKDEAHATRVRRLRNHGRLEKYDHHLVGRNTRLDALQARVLRAKLPLLDGWNKLRAGNAQFLIENLSDLPWLKLPKPPADPRAHVWHQFVVRLSNREDFRRWLDQHGIQTGSHYPSALVDLDFWERPIDGDFPVARSLASQGVSIPVGEHLAATELQYMVDVIRDFAPRSSES